MAKVDKTSGSLDEGRVTFERRPDDVARPGPARESPPEQAVSGAYQVSEAEARVLRWALEKYLPELGYELARIKLERDRHELVQKEAILSALLARLSRPAESHAATAHP